MIEQPKVKRNIHFVDQNGDYYCSNPATAEDMVFSLPLGTKAPDHILNDEHLCAICWCVWLSVMVERSKKEV